jgi:hypothetical protein
MNPEFYQWLSLILGLGLILMVIFSMIYLINYIELIKSNPCLLCEEQGYNCFKWDFLD